jgi:hypothetical protein
MRQVPAGLAPGVLAAVLALAGAGCEHVVTLRGQAVVPVDLQRQFTRDAPGLLLFGGGAGQVSLGADLVAVLCEPSDQPLAVPFRKESFDCAHEGTVWFRLTRMLPAEKDAVPCGIKQQNFDALVNNGRLTRASSENVVASASATVFAGKSGSCRSGEEALEVTLAPPPP